MSFPIYRHDMPWDDSRDSRARQGSKKNVESLRSERPSIWKRELSLGRKKDQPADVVAQAAEPEETTPALDETPTERTSIWKRELSFGRKKNAGDGELDQPSLSDAEPVSVDEESEAPSADKGPSIWKRELSFGRKNKDEHVEPESFEPESFEPESFEPESFEPESFEHESVVEAEP